MFRAKKGSQARPRELGPKHSSLGCPFPVLSGPGSHRMTPGNPGEVLSTGAGTVFPKPSQLLLVLKNKSMASTRRDYSQVLKT